MIHYPFLLRVLCILLYAVETWPIISRMNYVHSLEVFHHLCLRTTLGISREQRIAHVQYISNEDVQGRMGIPGDIISSCRLHWLGHI